MWKFGNSDFVFLVSMKSFVPHIYIYIKATQNEKYWYYKILLSVEREDRKEFFVVVVVIIHRHELSYGSKKISNVSTGEKRKEKKK